ncbi:Wzz/FepE/Etk N-terminal domain-containing protein [Gammaproteobacteria bacterium]|nr:Wzz/FepE/Etk N-terminal domain-containing protein [Gammaproteobacteria bacterium]MDB9815990.1 Wzz/FepE/Etk N-terminal domain-containing protein [Gammaproteobacteria bacterium]
MINQAPYPSEQDIDIRELTLLFWEKKKFIFLFSTFFFLISIAVAMLLPHLYESSATLKIIPSSSQSNSSNSSVGGKIGGAASVFLGGGSASVDYVLAEKTIFSRDFFKHLISFDGILAKLKHFDSYDPKSRKLVFSDDVFDPESSRWLLTYDSENEEDLSYLDAYRTYKSMISIAWQKDEAEFMGLSVTHASPYFAKDFLDLIIQETNSLVRQRKFEETQLSLNFLNAQLAATPIAEVKASINQIIRSQLNAQMIASVRKNYLLSPLDAPFIPDERSSPRRTLIVVLLTLFGACLSLIWVVIYHYNFETNRFKK